MVALSIIVPVYNGREYLPNTIDSILNQTFADFELILVDDGSTDGSGNICDSYAERDKRIRVLHTENSGQSSARNTGLNVSNGDYIGFVDDDDILHPQFYEVLLTALKQNNADIAACNFMHLSDSDMIDIDFPILKNPDVSRYDNNELVNDFFVPSWKIPVWNKIYPRSFIGNARFPKLRLGEDNYFSYTMLSKVDSLVYIDKALYIQRMHGNNFEFTGNKYYVELFQTKELILKDIKCHFPKAYTKAKRLFVYEGIRLFNLYLEPETNEYYLLAEKIMSVLRRNVELRDLFIFPAGQLRILWRIKNGTISKRNRISV